MVCGNIFIGLIVLVLENYHDMSSMQERSESWLHRSLLSIMKRCFCELSMTHAPTILKIKIEPGKGLFVEDCPLKDACMILYGINASVREVTRLGRFWKLGFSGRKELLGAW